MVNVFYVPIFFIVFRETVESAVIVSILLAFLKQQLGSEADSATYKRLRKQVWFGSALGLLICIIVGCGLIGAFYGLGKDHWSGTEYIWEGIFALIASAIISIMGAALLRVSKLQEKWRLKLAKAMENKDNVVTKRSTRFKLFCEKYVMFMLPFITVLREGLEAVVFVGGVTLGAPASSIPIPTITGLLAGFVVGFIIYKGGNFASLQIFLIISTCFLYLVAAGLFTRAVGYFEMQEWNGITGGDAAETGNGAGSYDITKSVWHVNCCNPELNGGGGWGIFNALFGWTNSATYGTVISYNVYWLAIIVSFASMIFYEKKGHWPFMKPKKTTADDNGESGTVASGNEEGGVMVEKKPGDEGPSVAVESIS